MRHNQNKYELTLLWFSAQWCGPCKQYERVMHNVLGGNNHPIQVEKIDVDDNQLMSHQYGLRAIPTIILLQGSTIVGRKTGYQTEKELEAWLANQLSLTQQ